MGDLKSQFDQIDKLLNLTPFFKCPACGKRPDEGTYFGIFVQVWFPVAVNDGRKTFEGRLNEMDIPSDQPDGVLLTCDNCSHNFPIPSDWKWEIN